MRLIDGGAIASQLRASVRTTVAESGFTPGLAAVLVGDDPASRLYVSLKERASAEVGIRFVKRVFPANAAEADVIAALRSLNADPAIHGIIVQLPLPAHLNEDRIIRVIDPAKDADGFHPDNLAAFKVNQGRVVPALVAAVRHCIAATEAPVRNQKIVVLANSPVLAEPLVHTFVADGGRAEYLNPSQAIAERTRDADILIVAMGQPHRITGDDVKRGAVLIDIGTTRVGKKMLGDIDSTSVASVAAWLTPVPGGVGPVTVAALLENVVRLARRR